jgi:3-hydroxybutyryl-CoA dehydrogenase
MEAATRVSVVGAGLMGHGIAQVFALRGHPVRVFDPASAMLDTLNERIRANLADLGQDVSAAERVIPTPVLADAVRDADVVIEAGPENLATKQRVFLDVEAAAPPGAILASNTSVIPITRIMAPLAHKSRALGTHWWNPPHLVPLVEVIRTEWTDPAVVARISALLRDAGKTPVTVHKDVPGFVGNRLQHALWREAIALVQNGVCDAETVDTVVKASFGRRLAVLGPLENADLVGTDLTLAVHETVLPDIDTTRGPLPYLRQLVESGRLGMKSGEGFRRWTPEEQQVLRRRVSSYLQGLLDQGF